MNEHESAKPSQSASPSTAGRRIVEVRIPVKMGESLDVAFPLDHEIVGYYVRVEMTRLQFGNGQQQGMITPVAVVLADQNLPETEIRRFLLAGVGTTVPEGAEALDCLAFPTNQGMRPAILFEIPIT